MEKHGIIRSTTLGEGHVAGGGGSSGNGGGDCSSSHGDNNRNQKSCTYKDFMNYKPHFLYGNEGVVGMTY